MSALLHGVLWGDIFDLYCQHVWTGWHFLYSLELDCQESFLTTLVICYIIKIDQSGQLPLVVTKK